MRTNMGAKIIESNQIYNHSLGNEDLPSVLRAWAAFD